jgi:predicted transcriptional regulator
MNLRSGRSEGLSIDPNYPRVMESESLARFLFELASDERLGILDAIAEKPMRHAQIARHLKMTDSETTRHLNRLASAGLLMKNPQSQYEPTNLARLVSAGFPFFRFLLSNREFLQKHNVRVLPSGFVERLGALTAGTFVTGMYDVAAAQVRYLRAVKQRIWVLTDQMFEQALPILREKAKAGADVRVIRSREGFEREIARLPPVERNYPVRLVPDARIFLAVLDDVAGVCFPTVDGKVDMEAMMLLTDPSGHRWASDLFAQAWSEAREWLGPPGAVNR